MKKQTTPRFPKVFPMNVGDVLELERHPIYEQKTQSWKVTKRTIKTIEDSVTFNGDRIVYVTFKECPKKIYSIGWSWRGNFVVRSNKANYCVINKYWHNQVID